MAIVNWLCTGDTHSRVEGRLAHIQRTMPEYKPEETAIVILGDVGLQYYNSKHDWKNKKRASKFGYTVYCLRGNHEMRPADVPGIKIVYDENVKNNVYVEEEFPLIRYLMDGEVYFINGKQALCIGGSYSVDKWYRLQNDWHWFANEQLTLEEMDAIEKKIKGKTYDFILTHTCPKDFEPIDLFLRGIDQNTVDKSMEIWFNKVKKIVNWKIWLWGHYHQDRIEQPYCEMFYEEVENFSTIWERWEKYEKTGELDWWLPLSPTMQKIVGQVC